jgi:hypothetical protein
MADISFKGGIFVLLAVGIVALSLGVSVFSGRYLPPVVDERSALVALAGLIGIKVLAARLYDTTAPARARRR